MRSSGGVFSSSPPPGGGLRFRRDGAALRESARRNLCLQQSPTPPREQHSSSPGTEGENKTIDRTRCHCETTAGTEPGRAAVPGVLQSGVPSAASENSTVTAQHSTARCGEMGFPPQGSQRLLAALLPPVILIALPGMSAPCGSLPPRPAPSGFIAFGGRTRGGQSGHPRKSHPGGGGDRAPFPPLSRSCRGCPRASRAEVAEGTRPSQQRRDGAGAAALGGEPFGVGAPLEPQREPHYRSTRGAAQGGRHRATAPRRCAAEHLLNTSSPHTSRAPSQNPAARSRARPLPFIAPGHAPRASPSSSCCHKPHLRDDVRVLSANSRGYCCRHSRGAHPDKTTRGSRPRLPGRGAADAAGSTGIHLRVCCSLLNAPLLSSPGCIKLQLLSPGIKSLEVAAGRPAVPGREGSGCARLSTEPMQAEVGRGEVMATPCVALGCTVGEPLTTDSCGAGLPAAPSACKLKTTHIWLLLTAGRMQLDDFKVPSNPTILWLYDL